MTNHDASRALWEKAVHIRTVSSELSDMRGPAFYLEEVYARDDAVKSLEGADFVLETVKPVMRDEDV